MRVLFTVALFLLLIYGSATASVSPQVQVAAPVQVSKAFALSPHNEVQIAVDPTDSQRLIACAHRMVWLAEPTRFYPTDVMLYASFDGGRAWQVTGETPRNATYGDPACTFGPDGTGYWMSFSLGEKSNMPLYLSTDGAKNWTATSTLPTMDREYVTVDDTNGPFRGRVYVHGTNGSRGIDGSYGNGITIYDSADRGKTWDHVTLQDEGSQYLLATANGIVTPDGTFATAFGDLRDIHQDDTQLHPTSPNAKLKFIASSDGGKTFAKAVVIEPDWYMAFYGLNGMPQLAVDATGGQFRARLYAVWVDARNGRGEIRSSHSADNGKTWSPSAVISDNWTRDPNGESPDAFLPALTVNRNGVVGVSWYDRRDHTDRIGYDIRFSTSIDGGDTFSPSVFVAPGGRTPLETQREPLFPATGSTSGVGAGTHANILWSPQSGYGGDTAGMAADAEGIFHPLWISRSTGKQQMWTTRIAVNAVAQPNGGGTLAALHDLSGQTKLLFNEAYFEPMTNTVGVVAAITNVSKKPLPPTVVLRLLGERAFTGYATAANSDNGVTTCGAAWVIRSSSNDALRPGQTAFRELRFRLSDRPRLPIGVRTRAQLERHLIELDTKLLGG